MEDINSPVFAQAKIEYTKQLIDVLKLPLYEGLQKIYNDSKRIFADGYEDELPNIFRKREWSYFCILSDRHSLMHTMGTSESR